MPFTSEVTATIDAAAGPKIPSSLNKLSEIPRLSLGDSVTPILEQLKNDQVVIVTGVAAEEADDILAAVSEAIDLKSALEIQSGFASIKGHRDNVGKYFMSVNKTADYEFIAPHSEGTQFTNMQIASMYCYENTTDGGETVLFNVDQDSNELKDLKEITWKIRLVDRVLSPAEIAMAKMKWQLTLPDDILSDSDEVIRKRESYEEGIELYEVLVSPPPTFSRILEKSVHVYWDNISSTDYASVNQYRNFLKDEGLLKTPNENTTTESLDHSAQRRVWDSGIDYEKLFKSKLIRKLAAGELVFMNNLTWTHAIANWTPNSGRRKIAVAFA